MNPLADRRAGERAATAVLAAVCYIPLLLTHRGQIGADTKSYLYLDPSRLLERAWSMWDPNVGLGTVTHQNIGYLWPMGPWFWFFDQIGVPDWVAQRLWTGSILFLAGLGVRFLLRTLGQRGPHVAASMFIYALSPFVLTLSARISALLLPFVGLPWMLGLLIRATRQRTWFHPALFALLIPTIGSTNATALLLAGLAPVLWLPFSVFVLKEINVREAFAVVGRIGILTVGASLWWMAGLYCQGAYGIDVLRYTETARTIADPSTAPELLRGLGYWFFYGDDKLGPWIEPSVPYTQNLLLIGLTYLIACIGLLSAGFVRWRYRAYFAALILVGLVAGVGAHPWDDPSRWGSAVKAFLLSDTGLAMRSLPRAVPLITLGMSVLAGMGVAAIGAWSRRMARPLAVGLIVLAIAALPPLWTGKMVASNLQRPEDLPDYWLDAAAFLDSRSTTDTGWSTRVLEIPGSDFASYRWGHTVDPILPGIMDRPYAARELIPYGTPISADLLNSFDRQLQEGVLSPVAVAPIARFMAVGDIDLRGDLQYERFNLARPRQLNALLKSSPDLSFAAGFGGDGPNVPDPAIPLQDELELTADPDLPNPDKVSVYEIAEPEALIRTKSGEAPVLLAGNGEGLIDAAAAGVLSGREVVVYSGSLAGEPETFDDLLTRPGTTLVLTDTNRRAATRWGTVHENNGLTEETGQEPISEDLGDNRLPLFPEAGEDAYTVAEVRGGLSVRATAYGNPVTYTPEDRATNALDDNLNTAWTVGGFSPVDGERIEITYDEPRTTNSINLVQSNLGVQNRWITKVRLRFDDASPLDVVLAPESRQPPGQVVAIPERPFKKLSIEILETDVGERDRYDNLSGVGFADIRLGDGDRRVEEVIRLPEDLLNAAGTESEAVPLTVLMTRLRSRPTAALRRDQEGSLIRTFAIPTDRSFETSGTARFSSRADGTVIDDLLGVTLVGGGSIEATSSRRLPGDIEARAISAVDGDPSTHYSPGFLAPVEGDFVRYQIEDPITFDAMNLRVLNDGRHSVPTRIRIEAGGKVLAAMDLPPIADQDTKNGTALVPLTFDPITGDDITVVFESVRKVETNDWISKDPVVMPMGIAELGIDGLEATVPLGDFDSGCRDDLLTVDDTPFALRLKGNAASAVAGEPLDLSPCTNEGLKLDAGDHDIASSPGALTGLDVDQLLLQSPASSGRPVSVAQEPLPSAELTIESEGRTRNVVTVGPRSEDTWLVLAQSHSLGWQATINGKDLGAPIPVDGFANGWLIPAGSEPVSVTMRWTPQRIVNGALIGSAITVTACLILIAVGLRRRRKNGGTYPARLEPGDQVAPFKPSVLWRSVGAPPSIRAALLSTLATGALTAFVIGEVSGVIVALITLLTLRSQRLRALTTLGPAVLLAGSAAFTIFSQYRNRLPAGFEWSTYFSEVHQVAYVGVALLAVDVLVDRLWTGHWWPRNDADLVTEQELA